MSETIGESEMEEPGQISRILKFSIPSTGKRTYPLGSGGLGSF